MKKLTELPEEIQDRVKTYRWMRDENYTKLREIQKEHEELFENKFDLCLDEENFSSQTRLPTAFDIVEAPANHIAMDTVALHIAPSVGKKGLETSETKRLADKREKWGQKILREWGHIQPYYLREFVVNLSLRGEGYLKLGIEDDFSEFYTTSESDAAYEGNPFWVDVPDPMLIFASMDMQDGCVPYEVYEEKVVTVRHVRRLLKEFNTDVPPVIFDRYGDSRLVTLVEWWAEKTRGYFAYDHESPDGTWDIVQMQGEALIENPFQFVPYVRGFSGYGKHARDGNPARRSVGILEPVKSTLVLESRLANILETIALKHALPQAVITVPEGAPIPKTLDLAAGTAFLEEHGLKLRFEPPPPVPPVVMVLWDRVSRALESFMPGITTGAAQPGEPAISVSMRLNQAGLKWENQYITSKVCIAKIMENVFRLVETFGVPIEIGGVTMTPDAIQGQYACEINIKPGNPDQLRFDIVQGMQLEGKLPKRMIIEDFYHEDDATQIQADLDADRMIESSPMLQRLIQDRIMEGVLTADELAAYKAGEETSPRLGLGASLTPQPGAPRQPRPPQSPGALPGVGGSPKAGVAALPQQEMTPPGGTSGVTP